MRPDLPEFYKNALRSSPGTLCTVALINHAAALVVKLDRAAIERLRGPIPIGFRSEAGFFDTGAVIRLVLDFFDQPDSPLLVDTFLSVAAPDDRAVLTSLAQQEMLDIHLFDPRLTYHYSKRIPLRETPRRDLATLVERAHEHNKTVARLDFVATKAAMMRARPI